jgi:hypothetical protein
MTTLDKSFAELQEAVTHGENIFSAEAKTDHVERENRALVENIKLDGKVSDEEQLKFTRASFLLAQVAGQRKKLEADKLQLVARLPSLMASLLSEFNERVCARRVQRLQDLMEALRPFGYAKEDEKRLRKDAEAIPAPELLAFRKHFTNAPYRPENTLADLLADGRYVLSHVRRVSKQLALDLK